MVDYKHTTAKVTFLFIANYYKSSMAYQNTDRGHLRHVYLLSPPLGEGLLAIIDC